MIEVKDLVIKYGDFVAINHINFNIDKGEFFTLLGPSGCGKTTTLRSIAGFIKPSHGQILIHGQDMVPVPVEERGIGMVFQSYALFPTMTVYDNIAFGLKVDGQSKTDINERVHELARLVELKSDHLDKNVSDLSGGQQQRVAIARALAKKPDIVLFDEPLSNLDAKLRKQLRSELKRIQAETGMTAIYVTHDQEEAMELSDHIAVFHDGKIDQIGTPEEIYNDSATEFVCNFIGEANRLSQDLMEYLNRNAKGPVFDLTKVHYIRNEKVKLWADPQAAQDHLVALEAQVKEAQFYGKFTNYVLDCMGTELKTLEKRDGNRDTYTEETLTIYLDPQDILEYEVNQ